MKRTVVGMLSLVLLSGGLAAAAEKTGLEDIWITEGGRSRVEITKRADGKFYGKIVWIKEPLYLEDEEETGQPRRDKNNPDPKLRSRPLMNLELLSGFVPDGENKWKKGTIYDPESGKTYKCKISMEGNDTLHVRGYIGISLLGRTTVWKRWHPEKEDEEESEAEEEES